MAGVDILHVPFRGAAPAMIDVIGGHTQMAFGSIPSTITHLRSGKLRALGVGARAAQRLAARRADHRRIRTARLRGRQLDRHRRAGRHAGGDRRKAAQGDFGDAGLCPRCRSSFGNEGAEIMRMSSAEFGKFIASETAKWGRVVKEAGIKAQ